MSEQYEPVRAWWEFDGTRVFGRFVQKRFSPDHAETWRYSYHPAAESGKEHEHYGYHGFEMPAVPTPLRSLRVLLRSGHEF